MTIQRNKNDKLKQLINYLKMNNIVESIQADYDVHVLDIIESYEKIKIFEQLHCSAS